MAARSFRYWSPRAAASFASSPKLPSARTNTPQISSNPPPVGNSDPDRSSRGKLRAFGRTVLLRCSADQMKTKKRKNEWFDDDSFWRELYPFMFPEKRIADAHEQIAK